MIFYPSLCNLLYIHHYVICYFIIHPCDPAVVIFYLIRPCDIAVHITYLISHSSSLSSHSVIIWNFWVGCIINTKLPSCVDIIHRTSLGLMSHMDSFFQDTSCENLMTYSRLYQHTRVVCIFIIHPCDPTVVICYLMLPCDIAVCITYLISHSYSLTYNLRIVQFGCIINTKLPLCDDIIRRTSLGFPSWCSESTRPTDFCDMDSHITRPYQIADHHCRITWLQSTGNI